MAAAILYAGVELGGTKCVVTCAAGPDQFVAQRTIATTAPDATLGAIEAVLDDWWSLHRFAALGIASFGPVELDPASPRYGHVLATPKPGWAMVDVGARLAARYPVPAAFDTDVNGAALAEAAWGAGRGLADLAYVTVGTGVGVGLLVGGRPVRGFSHAELGHLRVPRLPGDRAPSGCPFHEDCVEGLASGRGIEAALAGRAIDGLPPEDALWDRVASALACLCHAIVCATAPRRILIGGGVMARQPHLLRRIEPLLRASINFYLPIPDEGRYVAAPGLGDQAGPLGPIAMAIAASG